MKAESTIRNTLIKLRKRKAESDKFLEAIKDKPINENIIAWKRENSNLQGHIDALRWTLGE